MKVLTLTLQLKSDATFGRGEGVAGWVDVEVQHDPYGLPFLGGRTLKGMLNEECANILYSLDQFGQKEQWLETAQLLFGNPGSALENRSQLHVGDATLPADLRQAVQQSVESGVPTRSQVLESLTAVRRQTAVDAKSGAPDEHTLRTMRVILRETTFKAPLLLSLQDVEEGTDEEARIYGLLAACVKGLRRAGTGRNRGRGELKSGLLDENGNDSLEVYFSHFSKEVQPV